MPLIHSKKPKALSENIATEVRAGKPVKQAAAIAYSVQRQAEHKAHGGAIEDCAMCNGGKPHMAEGGEVFKRDKGTSNQGSWVRAAHNAGTSIKQVPPIRNAAKKQLEAERHIKPNLQGLAEGGEVADPDMGEDVDSELHDMMGEEMMNAIHSKDKKGIMACLEAIMLSRKNKE